MSNYFERVQAIFDEAVELEEHDRPAMLDLRCGGDARLRSDVESLLRAFEDHSGTVRRIVTALPTAGPPSMLADAEYAPDPMSGLLNQQVGPYRILERRGRGGMGVVYKAWDTRLDRPVALKFLPRHLSTSEAAKAGFTDEARAASALDHRNICVIYDIGETEEGHVYIAMAYYEGETLKEKIIRGALSEDEALDYALQAATGLAKAHQARIVHCDIKPANLLVTEDGVVKILDFGVARMAGAESVDPETTVGTVSYMSPEQLRGGKVDQRSDVWSFGAVLMEMLTGEAPFRGGSDPAKIYAILHADPDLTVVQDPALRAVIEACLNKNREERPVNGEALEQALTEIERRRDVATSADSPSGSGRRAIYWSGFAVAIVLAALTYVFWAQEPKPKPVVEPIPTLAVLPFEVSGGDDLQYLREGMVHLLAAKLDGLGDLASADVNATLSFIDRHEGRIDAEIGQEVSEQLGATGFVMGSIVEGGGSIRITASIYGLDGSKQATQEWSIGSDSLLLGAIDSLAIGLLSRRLSLQGRDIASVAVTTTRSMDALTHYLEGEKILREFGDQDQAIQAFLKAVEIDSTFALAWDGIASYAGTGFEYQSLLYPARRAALRHSAGLPDRITVIMRAQLLLSEDRWQAAEQLVQDYLRLHPTNPEAWYLLGEIAYHHWPRVGRSNVGAEQYFKRALALDPSNTRYFQHLPQYPIRHRRFDELLGIVESPIWTPFLEQQHAILTGALEGRPDGNNILPDSLRSIWTVVLPVWGRQPETAQLALARMTGPWRQNAEQYLRLATGQFSDAVGNSPLAPEHIVALWIPGFLLLQTYPEAELSRMKRQLQDWDDSAAPISEHWSPIVEVFSGDAEVRYPYSNSDLKIFASAMISWASGDAPGVDAGILALSPQTGYDSTWTASAANILRALKSLDAGDVAAAGQFVDQTAVRHWYISPDGTGAPINGIFPYYSEHMSRFLRAEILLAQHRYEEAKAWYTTFLDDADLFTWPVYFTPSIYKIGVCNEALGRYQEALTGYRDFIDFWSDADPGLQPTVHEARAGVERIERILASEG